MLFLPKGIYMAKVTLKGNPVQTNGELPPVNSRAPEFTLVDQDLKDRNLSDFKRKKKLVYIVPSLDTPTCSISSKKFNELAKTHPGAVILVVSADSPFAQKRFCGAEGVSNVITLSMMRNKDFGKDYGVLIQEGPLAGILARAVFVLDENDRIVYSELVPEITSEPNYDRAIAVLS